MITLQNLLIWKKCLPESKAICAEYSLKIVRLPVYNTGDLCLALDGNVGASVQDNNLKIILEL